MTISNNVYSITYQSVRYLLDGCGNTVLTHDVEDYPDGTLWDVSDFIRDRLFINTPMSEIELERVTNVINLLINEHTSCAESQSKFMRDMILKNSLGTIILSRGLLFSFYTVDEMDNVRLFLRQNRATDQEMSLIFGQRGVRQEELVISHVSGDVVRTIRS